MLAGFEYKWWIRLQDVLLQYNFWNITICEHFLTIAISTIYDIKILLVHERNPLCKTSFSFRNFSLHK